MGESKDEKKTSIWKKIGIAIASFFAGIVALLLGGLFFGKRGGSADEVRDDLAEAEAANRDAKQSVDSAKQSVDRLEGNQRETETAIERAENTVESIRSTSDDIEQCTDECQSIIDALRERSKEK